MADERQARSWGQLDAWSREFGEAVEERFRASQDELRSSQRHSKMQRLWGAYYSRGRDGRADDTEIEFTGDRGEIIVLRPARIRRIIQDHLATVQQTSPEPDPVATNTDPESQAQTHLARGVLQYQLQMRHLEELGVERAEMALVLGESLLHARWDPESGNEFAPDPMSPRGVMYEGDFVYSVRSPYEYAYDRTSPDPRRPRWWIVQEPADRYDLIAQFCAEPDEGTGDESEAHEESEGTGDRKREVDLEKRRQAILDAPKWSSMLHSYEYRRNEIPHDDSIAVYWVYIEPSVGIPGGRKALIGPDCDVLLDGELDYTRAGCFWLPRATSMLTRESHNDMFDGLPIAEAYAATISTILSNQAAYGGQRVWLPREAKIKQYELDNAITAIEGNAYTPEGNPIPPATAINLLQTAPEMFSMGDLLRQELDTVLAGSPVLRGDPNATKGDSGSKAVMLFAAAQNSGSPFLRMKQRSDSELYTWIIDTQKTHASVERTIAIAGENQRYTIQRYTGADLERVSRVLVPIANPARDTFQGRMAMAELLIDKPPEVQRQIEGLIYTGKLEVVTDDNEAHRMLLERENDALRKLGEPPPIVHVMDQHREHIKSHSACLMDLFIRQNPELLKRHEDHIAGHIAKLTLGHPEYAGDMMLLATGQQPLMPPGASPGGPGGPPGKPEPGAAAKQASEAQQGGMPDMPSMPKNAATGERMPSPGAMPEAPAM